MSRSSYVQRLFPTFKGYYFRGLLHWGVITLRVSYVQGLFTSTGTLLRSLALILKDFSYVQGLLLPGVLTFRRFYVEGFLYPGFLTFMGYYVKGFLRSGVLTPSGSYVQGFLRSAVLIFRGFFVHWFLRPGGLTSRVSYVQGILHPGHLKSRGSYVTGVLTSWGFYVHWCWRSWVLTFRDSCTGQWRYFVLGFLRPWVLRSGVLTSMGSNIQEFLRLFHLTFFSKGSIFHYRPLASGFDEKPETSDFR